VNYFIDLNGETYGPYTVGQLRSMWGSGQVTGDTLYCKEGDESWQQLRVLADMLELPSAPPPLPTTRRRQTRAFLILGVIGVALFLAVSVSVILRQQTGSNNSGAIAQPRPLLPSTAISDPSAVTEEYARRVNAFADKHDMKVEEVIRWDYVLTTHRLTLSDFDLALTKLGQTRDKAAGYHVEPTKRNLGSRRLVAGETTSPQSPSITDSEESIVKLLKAAGY
jgi:hypothetical protein